MTDKQDLIREIHEYVTTHGGENTATHLLVQAASAIQTQAAELEAIGAGGVSGPLMGQPQAMPDLTALTERGAKAWTGVDAQALREGRWYMVTHDGVATLCEDRRDAEQEAKDADMAWPHSGPHRAVQLVEASTAGFTAADMATASAQGFRDGVASVSASAGSEPVAMVVRNTAGDAQFSPKSAWLLNNFHDLPLGTKLYTHPSPPRGMLGGWISAEERLPESDVPVLAHNGKWTGVAAWMSGDYLEPLERWQDEHREFIEMMGPAVTHWTPLPLPPTTAAGSRQRAG